MVGADAFLQVDGIHSYYGKSHIIQGVTFNVKRGECFTLLGRNGAGKTTTLRTIMGLVPARQGRIVFDGLDTTKMRPEQAACQGIGYVPEDRQIFTSLTVEENLRIAQRKGSRWNMDRVFELFPRLKERRKNMGNHLSGGEQQMLAVGRALISDPSILLLDEPTEGLAPLIVEMLLETIQYIKQQGVTIVLVEQNVKATFAVTDHYCILQQGVPVYQATNKEFAAQPEIIDTYLGV